ncbi:MAG: hypothetical protein H6810_11905 [Phycisphaeraceae bacterium]|nr:MAG: hypothetical protein H6810_11905 [Phycisphaeraceae bacterium]
MGDEAVGEEAVVESSEVAYRPSPGWPKVVGILSVVFGGIAILFTVGGLALLPFFGGMVKGQLNGATLPPSMQLSPLAIGLSAYGALVNLLLIIAGFMTLARKASGRTMHLVYAMLGVVSTFLGLFYQFQMAGAVKAWAANYPDNAMVQQMASQSGGPSLMIGLVITLVLGLAWPVFNIIWFGMVKRDPESMIGTDDEFV